MSLAIATEPEIEATATPPVSLAVPSNLRLKVSPEDFWTLSQSNRDLRLERNAEGELIVMSPAGSESSGLEADVIIELGAWAKVDQTGKVFSPSAGFTLPNGAVRAPDAAWIKLERWKRLTKGERIKFAPIVPDFVIEICSPTDNRKTAQAKMAEYIEQGVRLGWLIDPRTPDYEVEIYRPGQAVEILSKPPTVSGEAVLPGFVLELGKILANID